MNNDQLNKPDGQAAEDTPSFGRILNSLCPVLSKENLEEAFERLISGMFEPLNQVIVFDDEKKDCFLCMRLTDYWNDVTGIDASQDNTVRIFTQLTSVFFRSMTGKECEEVLLALLNNELYFYSPKLCMTIFSAIKNAQGSGMIPDSADWNTLNNNLEKHAKSQEMRISFSDSFRQKGVFQKTWTKDFRKENGGKQ